MGVPRGPIVLICGLDPSSVLRALELDVDDHLYTVLESASKGPVGPHGWVGGAWQKNPLLLGYSGRIAFQAYDPNLSADYSTLYASVVPPGEIHVVTNIAIRYDGATSTMIMCGGLYDGIFVPLLVQSSPVSVTWYPLFSNIILAPGDSLLLTILGATLNDDAYMRHSGYRVDIDQ